MLYSLLFMLCIFFLNAQVSDAYTSHLFIAKQVRMVTGDNIKTAKAIALECGILDSEAEATEPTLIHGQTFRAMREKDRDSVADRISVWFGQPVFFIDSTFLLKSCLKLLK